MLLTESLRGEYQKLFDTVELRSGRSGAINAAIEKIFEHQVRYQEVVAALGSPVPWYVVGLIHKMESAFNFEAHLHNGDPLSARTVRVPKNRPLVGEPPFSWTESAVDALQYDGFDGWSDWSLPGILYKLEAYNGWGYRKHHPHVLSPYLWGGSTHYEKGHYVADHQWSDEAVAQQNGAAVLLWQMVRTGQVMLGVPKPGGIMQPDYQQVVKFLSYLGSQVQTNPSELNLLCLKGASQSSNDPTTLVLNDDQIDLYNDVMLAVYKSNAGTHLEMFRVTVDPSEQYTKKPMNKKGAAHLTAGQHWYKKGFHHGKPALRSLTEYNRVWRDVNGNFLADADEMVYVGVYGINIHAGGKKEKVGPHSAGCIAVFGGYDGAPYLRLMELVKGSGGGIPVTIWPASDFFRFQEEGFAMWPTLSLGTMGPWVGKLQNKLNGFGAELTVDGDWRTKTDGALRKFQQERQLTQELGWTGPKTWAALNGTPLEPVAPTQSGFWSPVSQGHELVTLHPQEAGTEQVTWGVPFAPGSLMGVDTVRVFDPSSQELPAFVDIMARWTDGSVRVARIQVQYSFANAEPVVLKVDWGYDNRQDGSTQLDPFQWQSVVVAGQAIAEPKVYVTLSRDLLCKGFLRPMPMTPFGADISWEMEAPEAFKAAVGQGLNDPAVDLKLEQRAARNFFFAMVNQDPGSHAIGPNVPENPNEQVEYDYFCDYKQFDVWLYDRASAFFMLYFRTGAVTALKEALRAANFYQKYLSNDGLFLLKNPPNSNGGQGYVGANGLMYSYNECLAYALWLTGNQDQYQEPIRAIADVHDSSLYNDEDIQWTANGTGYTTRHIAFRLLSRVVAYEVTLDDKYKEGVAELVTYLIWHQNGADGAVAALQGSDGILDGALWLTWRQEDYDYGLGVSEILVANPWQSSILVDAMVRAYAVTGDDRIPEFVRRMGTFLVNSIKPWTFAALAQTGIEGLGSENYGRSGEVWLVDNLTRTSGDTATTVTLSGQPVQLVDVAADGEHALNVASALAWAYYFQQKNGQVEPAVMPAIQNLLRTYLISVDYWCRPAAPSADPKQPAYRVSPWRKYAWQYRVAGSLSWCIQEANEDANVVPASETRRASSPASGNAIVKPVETPEPALRSVRVIYRI